MSWEGGRGGGQAGQEQLCLLISCLQTLFWSQEPAGNEAGLGSSHEEKLIKTNEPSGSPWTGLHSCLVLRTASVTIREGILVALLPRDYSGCSLGSHLLSSIVIARPQHTAHTSLAEPESLDVLWPFFIYCLLFSD